jgi:hypothetical protein
MSRTFIDDALALWEVFPSGGRFGLPQRPKVIFHSLSDSSARSRYVILTEGDEASAEDVIAGLSDAHLRELLAQSRELD